MIGIEFQGQWSCVVVIGVGKVDRGGASESLNVIGRSFRGKGLIRGGV